MPQFPPSVVKTARAPITVKPTGLSCGTELYLVSNGVRAASSGIKTFISTGARQDIYFPLTMPSSPGTYPVFLDILTNDQLIAAYKALEDVVISVPIIEYPDVDILGINNVPIVEAGVELVQSHPYGEYPVDVPYGILQHPVEMDSLRGVILNWINKAYTYVPPAQGGYIDGIGAYLRFTPEFETEVAPPVFSSWSPIGIPPERLNTLFMGFGIGGGAYGAWTPGIYSCWFLWGIVDMGNLLANRLFVIKNAVLCTGTGFADW